MVRWFQWGEGGGLLAFTEVCVYSVHFYLTDAEERRRAGTEVLHRTAIIRETMTSLMLEDDPKHHIHLY